MRSVFVVLALSTLGCGSRASIRAEVDIAAPPEVVWRVVSDVSRYGEWNPFITRVDGTLAVDAEVLLHVTLRGGRAQRAQMQRIVALVPDRCLVWQTQVGTRHMLRARRSQLVMPQADGSTRYRTTDVFTGGLVPLVMRMYRKDLQAGFDALTRGLKQRAEALAGAMPAAAVDLRWPPGCPSVAD